MKTKLKLILLSLFLVFYSCSKHVNPNEFILTGEFIGENTKELILTYNDLDNNTINDTIPLINGKFISKGFINEPTNGYLKGNVKSRGTSDPNYTVLYLEPKTMSIKLSEGKFKEAQIIGSITQREYENLSLQTSPLYEQLKAINKKGKTAIEKQQNSGDNSFISNEIKEIKNQYTTTTDEIKRIRLTFIKENPNSYLSAHWLNFYRSRIPLDSTKLYYSNLSPRIQKSRKALKVKYEIELEEKSMIGQPVPKFFTTDIKGNEFSLENYRGKYILLDFWAGWCVPCIKTLPELKQLYEKYHSKGLEIVSLSIDKNTESWRKAVEKNEIKRWNHIYIGKENTKADSISKSFNFNAIPGFILINKEGIIDGRYGGADATNKVEFSDLEKRLEEIFK